MPFDRLEPIVNCEFSTFVLRGNKDRNYGTDKASIIEGVIGETRFNTLLLM